MRSAGAVRIIGGEWNGRKIRLPAGREVRPTGGRVREAVFSCLGGDMTGVRCLDLFAGSGVLGWCAASRGAGRVTFVEKDRAAAAALRRLAVTLEAAAVRVRAMTAQRFLAAHGGAPFDVVFLDPPFADYGDAEAWARLLAAVAPHVAAGGRVYCESAAPLAAPEGWRTRVARRVGAVHWCLLSPAAEAA